MVAAIIDKFWRFIKGNVILRVPTYEPFSGSLSAPSLRYNTNDNADILTGSESKDGILSTSFGQFAGTFRLSNRELSITNTPIGTSVDFDSKESDVLTKMNETPISDVLAIDIDLSGSNIWDLAQLDPRTSIITASYVYKGDPFADPDRFNENSLIESNLVLQYGFVETMRKFYKSIGLTLTTNFHPDDENFVRSMCGMVPLLDSEENRVEKQGFYRFALSQTAIPYDPTKFQHPITPLYSRKYKQDGWDDTTYLYTVPRTAMYEVWFRVSVDPKDGWSVGANTVSQGRKAPMLFIRNSTSFRISAPLFGTYEVKSGGRLFPDFNAVCYYDLNKGDEVGYVYGPYTVSGVNKDISRLTPETWAGFALWPRENIGGGKLVILDGDVNPEKKVSDLFRDISMMFGVIVDYPSPFDVTWNLAKDCYRRSTQQGVRVLQNRKHEQAKYNKDLATKIVMSYLEDNSDLYQKQVFEANTEKMGEGVVQSGSLVGREKKYTTNIFACSCERPVEPSFLPAGSPTDLRVVSIAEDDSQFVKIESVSDRCWVSKKATLITNQGNLLINVARVYDKDSNRSISFGNEFFAGNSNIVKGLLDVYHRDGLNAFIRGKSFTVSIFAPVSKFKFDQFLLINNEVCFVEEYEYDLESNVCKAKGFVVVGDDRSNFARVNQSNLSR